jgi:transcriptional regulator with XRE-family HTH domain
MLKMKQVDLQIFAERLKNLREDHGLSTRALGEAVGTSNATISRYETGKRDPDLVLVHNIANTLMLPLSIYVEKILNSMEQT